MNESRADHAVPVQYGGCTSHEHVWPDERVPQERFDFTEGVDVIEVQ